MTVNQLISRPAVLAAMAEWDELGSDAFLEKYGFAPARTYLVVHNGRRYASKAIVGAAYGFQFPDRGALAPSDFSGGEATVKRVLERACSDEADGTGIPVALDCTGASPAVDERLPGADGAVVGVAAAG